MSSPATSANDALYHLYIGSEWTGPYRLAEVQSLLASGEVQPDTFAYEPALERHLTVEAVITESNPAKSKPATTLGTNELTSSAFHDTLTLPPAQAAQEFPLVIPELRIMYQAFLGLTESRTGDPHELANQLRKAQQSVSDALASRQSNTGNLYALVNQIDEVADYLANRHQIPELWQLISEMEKVDLAAETAHGIACANAVLTCLVDRAERHEPALSTGGSLSMLLDVDDEDEHDSVATRKILLSARHEMHSAKQDVNALQEAYSQLESHHQQDLVNAQRLLAAAEKARAEEHQSSEQAMAELRALAAEIHRLASEPDIIGGSDQELLSEVTSLGNELASTDPSTLAYLAEDVLIRMISRLRQLIVSPEDVGPLREELAKVRSEVANASVIAAERDTLKKQYQDQCRAAERANAQARDREHRLRSMVTALEVTKELHQEVMGDLQGELRSAQVRVETMERELAAVRGEIRGSSGSMDARSQELRDEMQRMVEMRSMLEVRREELFHHLETSESDLAKALADTSAGTDIAEALAAKIINLKQTFETTNKRLKDQEEIAKRIEAELSTSRSETNELHGRSDDLSRELEDARSSLTVAKKRVEELNTAYGRLENERSSLQQELANRKSTDTIRKAGTNEPETGTARLEKIAVQLSDVTKQAESLELALSGERRKVLALAEAQVDAQMRIEELSAERTQLRTESTTLQSERSADHARHASSLSQSIRASIESERRLKEAQEQLIQFELRLSAANASQASTDTAAADRSQLEQDLLQARTQLIEATHALSIAIAERDALALNAKAPIAAPGETTDYALTSAVAARDEVHAKLMQTVGERDRLKREFDRLKNEHEAAAVEHRTALKSARDRLTDAQNRTAELELLLANERQGQNDARPEQLRAQLADSLSEQTRLRDELQRHAQQIERLNSNRPSDRDSQLIELARATQQLSAEQERVQALTRSLVESLHASETARSRSIELHAKLAEQNAERERYQGECERLRTELAQIQLQGLSGHSDEQALREAIIERQQMVNELSRVNGELSALRSRETDSGNEESALNRLSADQARIRTLEQQLTDATNEHLKIEQMFGEAKSRLVQVSSERDRLAAEIEGLKSKPDYTTELRTMRRRLMRARERIRELRTERDQAVASQQEQILNANELRGQIERLRATQRAAAEALGLAPQPGVAEFHGTSSVDTLPGLGSTSRLGVALQPLISSAGEASSSQRGVPRALTRRIVGAEAPGSNGGFTSAFGRPSIPGIVSSDQSAIKDSDDQAVKRPLQTHVIHAPKQYVQGSPPPHAAARRWPWIVSAGAAAAIAGFMFLPPMLPCSSYGLVSATLNTVKAPIDGKVSFDGLAMGAQSNSQQRFADIDNDTIDNSVLVGLTSQKNTLESRQTALLAELARLKQRKLSLTDSDELNGSSVIGQLFSWRPLPGPTVLAPAIGNSAPDVNHDTPWNSHAMPLTKVNTAVDSQVQSIQQRINEVNDQLAPLAGAITEVNGKVRDENIRIETHRHAAITAPPFEIFWRRQVADHTWIRGGDSIATFTDPTTITVEALVAERYLDQLSIGDIARIQLLSDKRTIRGAVKSLLPANQVPENQAGSLPRQMSGRFLLTIDIAPGQQVPTIGQGIKVIILGQDPGAFTKLMAWLYETFRL